MNTLRPPLAGLLLLGATLAADASPLRRYGAGGAAPHPAVCRVAVDERDGQAFGSGTLIDARDGYGLVVTNWHVVRDATGKIEVRFPSGFTSEARPLKLDETWDLAALVVWRPPTEPAPLAARPPQPGDRLTICGYGQGDYRAITGRCTDYYSPEVGEPQELVELDVEARQGDSGGPIFNDRGELAGVLFGAARGTTLGSFGGRVQTFLATLAPDIGARQPTMLAAAPTTTRPPHASVSPRSAVPPAAIDPFVVAEQNHPRQVLPVAEPPPEPATPPPSLADRSAAPRLAAARQPSAAWESSASAPRPANPWFAAAESSRDFTPESSATAGEPIGAEPLDWYEDGRTLLALVGVAALVASGLRAMA